MIIDIFRWKRIGMFALSTIQAGGVEICGLEALVSTTNGRGEPSIKAELYPAKVADGVILADDWRISLTPGDRVIAVGESLSDSGLVGSERALMSLIAEIMASDSEDLMVEIFDRISWEEETE